MRFVPESHGFKTSATASDRQFQIVISGLNDLLACELQARDPRVAILTSLVQQDRAITVDDPAEPSSGPIVRIVRLRFVENPLVLPVAPLFISTCQMKPNWFRSISFRFSARP